MFGRGRFDFSMLIFLLLSVGCAQPKYEKAPSAPGAESTQAQSISDCEPRFQKSGHCLLWKWEKMPTSATMGKLVFKIARPNLLDGTAIPVQVTEVPRVVLWMPSMGHGSTPTVVEAVDVGSFRVNNVFFVMPGDWEVRFQVRADDGELDEAVLDLLL